MILKLVSFASRVFYREQPRNFWKVFLSVWWQWVRWPPFCAEALESFSEGSKSERRKNGKRSWSPYALAETWPWWRVTRNKKEKYKKNSISMKFSASQHYSVLLISSVSQRSWRYKRHVAPLYGHFFSQVVPRKRKRRHPLVARNLLFRFMQNLFVFVDSDIFIASHAAPDTKMNKI